MIRLRRKYMIWNLRIKTIRPPVQCEWEAYYRHYLKNVFFDSWDTDRLLDMLEKGKLTGNLKKVAEKMTVDDNPLLILYKFK